MRVHRIKRLATACCRRFSERLSRSRLKCSGPAAGAANRQRRKRRLLPASRAACRWASGSRSSSTFPAEASEIFVGDPKVANAIVRSARRLYIDAVANGQTSIFALDKSGRQIAVFEISVGRDVGELSESVARRDSGQ